MSAEVSALKSPKGHSKFNIANKLQTVAMIRNLLQHGFNKDNITIVVMYQAQRRVYIRAFSQIPELAAWAEDGKRIRTVDSFEGDEDEIIILDVPVAANLEGKLGFGHVSPRLNVAISRTKNGFILISDTEATKALMQGKWKEVAKGLNAIFSNFLNANLAIVSHAEQLYKDHPELVKLLEPAVELESTTNWNTSDFEADAQNRNG